MPGDAEADSARTRTQHDAFGEEVAAHQLHPGSGVGIVAGPAFHEPTLADREIGVRAKANGSPAARRYERVVGDAAEAIGHGGRDDLAVLPQIDARVGSLDKDRSFDAASRSTPNGRRRDVEGPILGYHGKARRCPDIDTVSAFYGSVRDRYGQIGAASDRGRTPVHSDDADEIDIISGPSDREPVYREARPSGRLVDRVNEYIQTIS